MINFHLWQVDFENILTQSHTIHEKMKKSTQNDAFFAILQPKKQFPTYATGPFLLTKM
jgi:hypothetical protein